MSARAAAEAVGLTGDLEGQAAPFQPELFDAKVPIAVPVDVAEARERRPGRPKGAVNRTTAEMIEFIQRTKGDPRLALAKIMATPIPELARELFMTRKEAAEFWKVCTLGLLPYVAGKPAMDVNVRTNAPLVQVFAGGPAAPAELPAGGVIGLLERAAEIARSEGFAAAIGPETIEGESEVISDG